MVKLWSGWTNTFIQVCLKLFLNHFVGILMIWYEEIRGFIFGSTINLWSFERNLFAPPPPPKSRNPSDFALLADTQFNTNAYIIQLDCKTFWKGGPPCVGDAYFIIYILKQQYRIWFVQLWVHWLEGALLALAFSIDKTVPFSILTFSGHVWLR